MQVIEAALRIEVPVEDLSGQGRRNSGTGKEAMQGEAERPFDLARGPVRADEAVEARRAGASYSSGRCIMLYQTDGRRECSTGSSRCCMRRIAKGRENPLKPLTGAVCGFCVMAAELVGKRR